MLEKLERNMTCMCNFVNLRLRPLASHRAYKSCFITREKKGKKRKEKKKGQTQIYAQYFVLVLVDKTVNSRE